MKGNDMTGNDNMEPQSKLASLMELVKEMKRLQGEDAAGKPHGLEVEVHAQKLSPADLEHAEEVTHQDLDNDQEQGESPEHQALVLGDQSEDEECEPEEDEDHGEMEIPEGLMKLLAEKLHK